MKRSPMVRTGILRVASHDLAARKPARKSKLKTKQRAVTAIEKAHWSRLASEVGCIACLVEGNFNPHVSIHHINGRTVPGCHSQVLPLCAGHHQDGTGEDKSMLAVHPWKARFEARYGAQDELQRRCALVLEISERFA